MTAYQIGWFSTARGPGSRALLKATQDAIESGELKARIAFVFCSREPGESEATDQFIKMVKDYGTPLVHLSLRKFKAGRGITENTPEGAVPPWRADYDREVMSLLKDYHPDLCVLAGYMLVASKEMCRKYNMINLHPAAPGGPTGTWQEVIWKLIESRAERTGVMMHLVVPELDKGPVATYCTFAIRGEPFDRHWAEIAGRSVAEIKQTEGVNNALFKIIRQHGMVRELPLVVATLKAFSDAKVRINGRKQVVDAAGRSIAGYDLTREIDGTIKGKF